MSKVMPTKPGWWWATRRGVLDIACVWTSDRLGLMVDFHGGDRMPVGNEHIEWLAPVPSVEAVQAAVEALAKSNELLDDEKSACCFVEEVVTIDYQITRNKRAIAGLTGDTDKSP